jgi:hypothetical protein
VQHLWSALTSLASTPAVERTLTGLSVLLQSGTLKRALQPCCVGGPWGRLLDGEAERLGEADVAAFETEGLIGTAAAPAVLAYLFHRVERRLDGQPTLLIVDEGWLALDDPTFGAQLREWLKTLRKKNASVVFATQSLAASRTARSPPPSSRAGGAPPRSRRSPRRRRNIGTLRRASKAARSASTSGRRTPASSLTGRSARRAGVCCLRRRPDLGSRGVFGRRDRRRIEDLNLSVFVPCHRFSVPSPPTHLPTIGIAGNTQPITTTT